MSKASDFIKQVEMGNVRLNGINSPLVDLFARNNLVKALNGNLSITRNSVAMYEDYQGIMRTAQIDEPRQEKEGWLLEGESTNLLLQSSNIGSGTWGKNSGGTGVSPIVVVNNAEAPDGSMNADTVTFNTGVGTTTNDQSYISQNIAGVSIGEAHTHTHYIKGTLGDVILLRNLTGGDVYTSFTLDGTWQRLSTTSDPTAGTVSVQIGLRQAVPSIINNTVTVAIWGGQVEEKAFATSPIPTVTTTETREADVVTCTVDENFNSVSSWVLQCSFLGETTSYQTVMSVDDGTTGNRILIGKTSSSNPFLFSRDNMVTQFSMLGPTAVPNNTEVALVATMEENSITLYENGERIRGGDIASITSNLTNLSFNSSGVDNSPFYGHIRSAKIFDFILNIDEIKLLSKG